MKKDNLHLCMIKPTYRLIFASDGFTVMNVFNLLEAGYIDKGGVLIAEHNNKVSLYIQKSDLTYYGKIGYETFFSKEKTKQLIDDINKLIQDISLLDTTHSEKVHTYTTEVLAESLKETTMLSTKFISLYRLIESHYTFYTEDVINSYISQNNEGLKGKTVFDVIFDKCNQIQDIQIKDLCENVAVLAQFKMSTKQNMSNLFKGHSVLVREARKRFGLVGTEDIRLLSLVEIQDFLARGFSREEFERKSEERKDWFMIVSDSGGEPSIFFGLDAKEKIEDIKKKSGLHGATELKGQTASLGLYTGRAVVIPYIRSIEDETYKAAFLEFRKGDILITKNSVPEIMEIIKKAGAIVTEEGGITCHGAIMSREFKVPGIVGVDGVVDHIKTGDTLEVDARGLKGIVRIIGR